MGVDRGAEAYDKRTSKAELLKQLGILRSRVAELEQAERTAREAKLRWEALLQNAPVGIGLATRQGQIIQANDAMLRMIGYSRAEMGQINLKDAYQDPSRREQLLKQLETYGFVTDFDAVLQCRCGSLYHASLAVRQLAFNGQDMLLTSATDVTRRKVAEEEVKSYQFIVESAQDAIFLKDAQSRYLIANQKTFEVFGLPAEQVLGKNDREIMRDAKTAEENMRADNLVFTTAQPLETTKRMVCAGDEERWFQTVKVPRLDGEGNVIGLVGIARDVTSAKRANDELAMYHARRAESERLASLGTLSATLAHQLAQPLTVIRMSLENTLATLDRTSVPGGVIEELNAGLRGVANAAGIADRFRRFARKSSEGSRGEVNLQSIAEGVIRLLDERAWRVHTVVRLEGMETLPPVHASETDMEQLFFVLVENAIDAADGKKNQQIVIRGTVQGEDIELRFTDNGCGIAPENLDKLFEAFFTTKSQNRRTGLGLCIARDIVARAGGRIWVESQPGEGSIFYVAMPIRGGVESEGESHGR